MKPNTVEFWMSVASCTVSFWIGWVAHYAFNRTNDPVPQSEVVYHTNTITVPIERTTVAVTNLPEDYITNYAYIPRLDVQTPHWGQDGEPSWIVMRDTVTHADYFLVWTKGTAVSVTKLEGQ